MKHLVFSAIFLSVFTATPVHAEDAEYELPLRGITVTGQAERKVVPDEAHIHVNISATQMKIDAAKTEHDAKLKKVMAIAEKAGIDEKKVKTLNSNVQPQYAYENNTQLFKGYRAETQLDITIAETTKVGDLMEALSTAGLENKNERGWGGLLNLSYTVSNPDKLRDEMLAEAIANARAKADRMATAAGAKISRVWVIQEGNAPQFHMPMPMMARGLAMASDASMEKAITPPAGEQQVNATVTVTFEMKD